MLLKVPKNNRTDELDSVISDVLFSSIGEGAVITDERGNISHVNKVALDILGFSKKDLLGKWFPGTLVAEDEEGNVIPNINRPATEVFVEGKTVFRKLYYRRKDNTRVPVALTVSPILHDNKPLGAIEVFRDISEEIQLEKAKDEFISIASHQLRTPASIVKQYLGMILEGVVTEPEKQMKLIKTAYEHNNNQLEIINELLQVAQAEANKVKTNFVPTDIVVLINKIVEDQKPNFDSKDIKVEVHSEYEELTCCLDSLHIQMVIENILHNASKYSSEGSSVRVEITGTPANAVIKITDKGIGISEEDIPKLFKKFSRAENVISTASGTGLGLYWAKKLVDLHKGKINVESVLEKGTTFTICIPREVSS